VNDRRGTQIERLRSRRLDLLVVGGGIIGAGVAELAARHGLAVALIEADDFGSGTSSASSKLVHGGLRYLRMGRFSLVREALNEVRVLNEIVAPHLVRRLPFVLPVYRGGPYGRIPIRGALWSYAGLTGAISERGRMVAPATAAELVPGLRRDGLRAAGLYADAQTDDARLTLANVRGAADNDAIVLNGAELAGLERGPVATVRIDGAEVAVAARAIVNATGAWIARHCSGRDPWYRSGHDRNHMPRRRRRGAGPRPRLPRASTAFPDRGGSSTSRRRSGRAC
jgi:glycerol-3-phosphate dehydrogenase